MSVKSEAEQELDAEFAALDQELAAILADSLAGETSIGAESLAMRLYQVLQKTGALVGPLQRADERRKALGEFAELARRVRVSELRTVRLRELIKRIDDLRARAQQAKPSASFSAGGAISNVQHRLQNEFNVPQATLDEIYERVRQEVDQAYQEENHVQENNA